MLSTWYCTWCCMIFFLRKMFLASAATLCSSLFFIICHTLCMALNVYVFLKFKIILLNLSTWTASWSFVRWPLRFTSSSHSLQVKYSDHFLMKSQYMETIKSLFSWKAHLIGLDVWWIFSPHYTFLASAATSCSSVFSMVYHTLSMFHHKMFV